MQKRRLVIFDLDGTLVDAYPAIESSLNYVLARLGYPRQKSLVIRRAVGWGDEFLLKPFVRPAELKAALILYRRHHKQALLRGSSLFPRVKELLGYLKDKGYLLAVASNRPTRFSRILIRHLGLARYFDYILCADKLKQGKPHPEILQKIISRFCLHPQDALYVGDMAIDIQTARRAGIRCIIVTTGSSSAQEIRRQKPYRLIRKISSLFKLL